jgi:proline iminopeptidase
VVHVDVNRTRLWFDVDGPALVPDGDGMRRRPTVVLLHGGPFSYDHSYFKPHLDWLTEQAQVVYLDLRGHGRSAPTAPAEWSLEQCADDVAALCDRLGIDRPVVVGHSMGAPIALLHAARHPGRAAGVVVLSGFASWDHSRLVEGFRRVAGDEVAALADVSYAGGEVSDEEWGLVFGAFGPHLPDDDTMARRVGHAELGAYGMELVRRVDLLDGLGGVEAAVLVVVGTRDPVTPVAAAEEIVAALPPGRARLEVLPGAGHFPWLDQPDLLRSVLAGFVAGVDPA